MGFITSLTLNNDFLDELSKEDPGFGPMLRRAVLQVAIGEQTTVPRAGITVVESHHVDYALAILVGGGKEASVIKGVSVGYTNPDPELEVLRQLAHKYEYVLHKRRAR